jgi:Tfp pilus assembly protein PilE
MLGYTMPELTMVVVIMGIFVFAGSRSYSLATEQGRVDQAQATLHSVWIAQRLYKLEHATFASSFDDLADALYLGNGIGELSSPFSYSILFADQDEFIVQGTRSNSSSWFGQIHLNHNGLAWGTIIGNGKIVTPATLK